MNNPFQTQIGLHTIELGSVDSTNDYLKRAIERDSNLPDGTLVLADYQTHGKGQLGNHWVAEPSTNILMSFLFRPMSFSSHSAFALNIAASLALYDTVAHFIPKAAISQLRIKWPNDIFFQYGKLAGILIENQLFHYAITQSIVGIGLNVNQTYFPYQPHATSLATASGDIVEKEEVLEILLANLNIHFTRLQANIIPKLQEEYVSKLLGYKTPEQYHDLLHDETFNAKLIGVEPSGHCILQLASGESRRFEPKQVKWIAPF